MKKTLVVVTRTRHWENTSWQDSFLIDSEKATTDEQAEKTLRTAIVKFLKTPEGKHSIKNSCDDFNWGDVFVYIPNSFWNTFGIQVLHVDEEFVASSIKNVSVDQDEVLC